MTNPDQLLDLIGRNAIDVDGDKIGKIGQLYTDDRTGDPQWVTVSTGLFGSKQSFAPLYDSKRNGDDLQLAVTKEQVKDAPNVDDDGHLEDDENDALFAHYRGHLGDQDGQQGGQPAAGRTDRETGDRTGDGDRDRLADVADAEGAGRSADRGEGRDVSGPNTDDAMTRSEERLRVGTEQVEAGRARLRKYVVTENVTQTVPVSHEEVRIEREPITDANRDEAVSGEPISEEEHEVTLHAERPVVDKETVPVERVKLGTETVTEEQTVSEEVRKEQIDTPDEGRSRR
ncbi:conserved domain-containing protein [Jatrophihabitans endophyticus]|uniref:Conserved domain-containing protein n=1 Tax=Jatrophihabitans endophyticus TaxID=1206085 RepID=A0A1M5E1N8_9ACTN|nr:PRC and DUF2382 domain-containing protein [Jatrophihabitans endophyticus]SHF73086.1 conserved domain-containing protein [Jatrophihabitans endophyticus]